MGYLADLNDRFIGPAVEPHGLRLEEDMVFRKWNARQDICALVAVVKDNDRYSLSVGFFSPLILGWFGVPAAPLPTLSMCHLSGIVFRVCDQPNTTLQMGWIVRDDSQLQAVGTAFRESLEVKLPQLLNEYTDFRGWSEHFRDSLARKRAGRGRSWSMLGYSLLASGARFDEVAEVIAGHASEESSKRLQNRIELHLAKQREIALERFGRAV